MRIRHELTIEVKDGRYRYTMTDFVVLGEGKYAGNETPLEAQVHNEFMGQKTWERVHSECLGIVASLAKEMNKPATSDKW